MSIEEIVTTALDALALVLIAAGVLAGLWPVIGGWSIACGGVVVFLGVRVIDGGVQSVVARLAQRKRET